MPSFQDLDITTLRKICSRYNLHTKITKYSKLTKDQLIPHMEKHLHINAEGKIKIKKEVSETAETEINKMLHELKNKVKEVKEKVIKIQEKKEEKKPEEKKKKEINIEEMTEKEKAKKVLKHYSDISNWGKTKRNERLTAFKNMIDAGLLDEILKVKHLNSFYKRYDDYLKAHTKPEEKKEIQIDEKEEKKTYDKYEDYNEDEAKFMDTLRDKDYLYRPNKIKGIYHMNYEDNFIGKFYIHRMQEAKPKSLERLKKQIDDTKTEHYIQVKIDDLNEKIKNNTNAFKTKKAQKKADEKIYELRNQKYPMERELERYNKIRDIQKQNYKKLKDMKIETVKDADEYADIITSSEYMNMNDKLEKEEKKKDEEHQEFINSLGKKIDEEEKNPVEKIEKLEKELHKLEQIININEKENKMEHKQLQEEITETAIQKMKIKELKELAKKYNISTTQKVNNKDVSKSAPMLKKELIEKIPIKKSKINKSMTRTQIYDAIIDMDDEEREQYLNDATLKEVQIIARFPVYNVKLNHSKGNPKSKKNLIDDIMSGGGQN
jgi:hypothetical protein